MSSLRQATVCGVRWDMAQHTGFSTHHAAARQTGGSRMNRRTLLTLTM
ncbi:MAG TPA: hypothetical protein VHY35_06965 [Stellaceae bacterium]|nr:hypothetical protein [Stellaceae bacterium]